MRNWVAERSGELYWRLVPTIVRQFHRGQYRKWNAPLDPFEPIWVNPDRIERTTGREYPAWNFRGLTIGSVRDGDWDQRVPNIPDTDLATEPFIEDSVLFRSFELRFKHGVSWDETPLYPYFESNEYYNTDSKLDEYDQLADRIQDGYCSQRELFESGKLDEFGYYDVVCDEICIDIGRDGELLFVDGRHRLAIAKALELDTIPVIVAVRHKRWMNYRDQVYKGHVEETHPDLPKKEI